MLVGVKWPSQEEVGRVKEEGKNMTGKGKRSRSTTRRGEKRLRGLSADVNFSYCHEQHMIAVCCIIQSCHYFTNDFLTYFFKRAYSALNLPLFFKSPVSPLFWD